MPKELVYGPNPTEDVIEHVAVGWARAGGVQLGFTRGPHTRIEVSGPPSEPYPSAAGHPLVDLPEPEPVDSLWLSLDRKGINHLIRSLRKARDAAYGADA